MRCSQIKSIVQELLACCLCLCPTMMMRKRAGLVLALSCLLCFLPGSADARAFGDIAGIVINAIIDLLCALPLVGDLFCGLISPPKMDGMNIVLFYADDWTFRNLGLVNGIVKTPHVDEMAAKGVMFRYNCVVTSICWISRATLQTGQYSSVHKMLYLADESMFDTWDKTLYPSLKSNDYSVGYVGKWSVSQAAALSTIAITLM